MSSPNSSWLFNANVLPSPLKAAADPASSPGIHPSSPSSFYFFRSLKSPNELLFFINTWFYSLISQFKNYYILPLPSLIPFYYYIYGRPEGFLLAMWFLLRVPFFHGINVFWGRSGVLVIKLCSISMLLWLDEAYRNILSVFVILIYLNNILISI